jgi:hypothetical protein
LPRTKRHVLVRLTFHAMLSQTSLFARFRFKSPRSQRPTQLQEYRNQNLPAATVPPYFPNLALCIGPQIFYCFPIESLAFFRLASHRGEDYDRQTEREIELQIQR